MARIVQEALNHVRRHADASRVDIMFQRLNGNLRVEIRDDGSPLEKDDELKLKIMLVDDHALFRDGLRAPVTGI